MRHISINGLEFDWKLTASAAKGLGIPGPGSRDGLVGLLQGYSDDWDKSEAVIIAGCKPADVERVKAGLQEWGLDDWQTFVAQAFGEKNG